MAITVTHLEGPLAGKDPKTFDDNVKEISFGRSRENDVVFPAECGTVGRADILLAKTGPRSYEVRRRGLLYLGIDGRPIPEDLNNIPLASGSVVRLGGSKGPSFRIDMEEVRKPGPFETAITQVHTRVRPAAQQIAMHRRGLIASVLGLGIILSGLAFYLLVYTPNRYDANIKQLLQNTYLVVKKDGDHDKSAATAFVIGKNQLATNAHVTEAIRKAPEQFYLKGPQGNKVEIEKVETHPAYKLFQHKKFLLGNEKAGKFEHLDLQGAYDVGVITVESEQPLSEQPLGIAAAEDIIALEAGRKLTAAGFPSEGILAADHATKDKPVPLISSGEIRGLNNIFQTGGSGDKQLVQHSLPAAGGVSGSPVIDAWTGEVVAVISGGNIVLIGDRTAANGERVRMPSAAMVNFAQRADLLREMLDGTAAGNLPVQQAYWDEEGKKHFVQYADFVQKVLRTYAADAYGVGEDETVKQLETGTLMPPGKGRSAQTNTTFDAEPGFVYGLLAILSGDPESREKIDIGIYRDGSRVERTHGEALTDDTFSKWTADKMPSAWVRVSEPTKLDARLNGFINTPVDYTLYLYRWPAPPAAVTSAPIPQSSDVHPVAPQQ